MEEDEPSEVYCDYCEAEVHELRLECTECPDFDLCPECFASGAEIGPHKRTHKYKLVFSKPIFESHPSWTAFQELALVESVNNNGFNWKKIAESLKPKTSEEVEKHFNEVYVDGNIGRVTFSAVEPLKVQDLTEGFPDEAEVPESASQNVSEAFCKEIHYKPRIGEFKEEYDDEADAELYEILKLQDNSEEYAALKSALLSMYKYRLQKRHKVKKLLWEYDLIRKYESQLHKMQSPKMSKEESALREKLKVFCRFMPAQEFDKIIGKMLEEQKVKARIKELQAKITEQYSKDPPRSSSGKVISLKGRVKGNKQKKVALSASSSNQRPMPASAGWKESAEAASSPCPTLKDSSVDDIREPSLPPNISNFLSRSEKRLCANLDLEPSCYMALKTTLLKDRNVMKASGPVKPNWSFPPEMNDRVQKVANFMVESGWICPS